MMQTVYEMTIDMIAKHYGLDHQQMKTIEELSEASAAVARHVTEPCQNNLKEMASELADVCILIDQLFVLHPTLKMHFEDAKRFKVTRQIRRMIKDAGWEKDD